MTSENKRVVVKPPRGIDMPSWQALQPLLEHYPQGFHVIEDIVERRLAIRRWSERVVVEIPESIKVKSLYIDRNTKVKSSEPDHENHIEIRRFDSTRYESKGNKPALIFIHGGGMIIGDIDGSAGICYKIAEALPISVFALSYRKAPENPYPAGLEDCVTATRWIFSHNDELGIDSENIGAYGPSAGGGLVLALALKLRDLGEKNLNYMMPIYPMIDDRCDTPAHKSPPLPGVWDSAANRQAWNWYLGGKAADWYAAPSRAKDLSGLPPCYSDVGTFDLFLDDDVNFFKRLAGAEVPTQFHIFPGAFHGSENLAPGSPLSVKIWESRIKALSEFVSTKSKRETRCF